MDVEESSDNEILMDNYKTKDPEGEEKEVKEGEPDLEGTARNMLSKNQSTEGNLTQRSMLQTTRHEEGDKMKKISKYQKTQTEVKLAEHT